MDLRAWNKICVDSGRSDYADLTIYEILENNTKWDMPFCIRITNNQKHIQAINYCTEHFGPLETIPYCKIPKRWTCISGDGVVEFYFLHKGDAVKFKLMGF